MKTAMESIVASDFGATLLPDGVYRVETAFLCAGFVVKDNRVVECAPILRKRLDYWKAVARRGNDGR